MKVVILCGGFGTRLREETETRPKPMVEVGGKPILWHIMKSFAHYGFNDFILCLGYKADIIKNYFLNYQQINNDFSVDLANGTIEMLGDHGENDWRVTLADTGLHSMTGARVKRIEKYIDDDYFMLTYGDGVTDLNINDLMKFHQSTGKIGTVTGVTPPSRYGDLGITGETVVSFHEKPEYSDSTISGGYFVFHRRFFEYLSTDEDCVLEREPLEQLTRDRELGVYAYKGFWQCMDTHRDYLYLNDLWNRNQAAWKVWENH